MKNIVGSFAILNARDKLTVFFLLVLSLINSLVQTLGIVSIMPFIAILTEPGIAETNKQIILVKEFLDLANYNSLLIAFGTFTFVSLILSHFFSTLTAWANQLFFRKKEHKLTIDLLNIFLSKTSTAFYKIKKTQILKYILADVDRVLVGTQAAVIGLISDVLICIVVFSLLLYLDVWVTLATTLILTTCYLLIYGVLAKKINNYGKEFATIESKIYSSLNHAIDLFREIKVSGHQNNFVKNYSDPSQEMVTNSIRYYLITFLPTQILEILAFGLLIVVATYFAAFDSSNSMNAISIISIFAFATYRMVPLLNEIFDGIEEIIHNSSVLEELLQQFNNTDIDPAQINSAIKSNNRLELNQTFGLQNVSFKYGTEHQDVLADFNVTIRKGQFVCLSGKSGAGKSTILDILLGLIKPDSGSLLVDEKPLQNADIRKWQNNIGYVPQKILFLNGTVSENIAFGIKPNEINHKLVTQAAKLAAIDNLIENQLTDGYDTVLGDGGAILSGGEKQRIGIARSLYHNPQVLIFDEATNELDKETESQILDSIQKLENKTIIFVSHKQAVADIADEHIIIKKLQINEDR